LLLLILAAGVFAAGCSHKPAGVQQVKSELRSALSLATESEVFVDFAVQGQATRAYAEGQAAYLADAAGQASKELEKKAAERDLEDSVRECRTELDLLAREISRIRAAIARPGDLAGSRTRIEKIRERLAAANSAL